MKFTRLLESLLVIAGLHAFGAYGQQTLTHTLEGYSQGTTFHIVFVDSTHASVEVQIIDLLKEIDSSISVYNPASLLSQLNRNETTRTDRMIRFCFRHSLQINRQSDGAFDPSVFPLLIYYGMGPQGKAAAGGNKDSISDLVGLDGFKLRFNRLIKDKPGAKLDFNAMAQGYSVDLIGELLEKAGISSYLVELGGEVRARGLDEKGEPWLVGVERPDENSKTHNALLLIVGLRDKAIATSGNYRKFVESEGKRIGHQLDPRSKEQGTSDVISATVVADESWLSDAYATVFCVLSAEEGKRFYEKVKKQIEVMVIYRTSDGGTAVWESPGFSGLVRK